jgi:hypothetical protein
MIVSIPTHPIVGVPYLTFARWLPLREEDALTVTYEEMTVKLSIDLSCASSGTPADESERTQHLNLMVEKVVIVVALTISERLARYIRETTSRSPADPDAQAEYEMVASKVYLAALTTLNRLIAFARVQKGQYWLFEYPVRPNRMSFDFLAFDAKVIMGETESYRWQPPGGRTIQVRGVGGGRYISQSDWNDAKRFVQSSRKPPLLLELLSSAETYAGNDHRRAALVEAVTALEVAISEFAKQSTANEAFGSLFSERMGVASLKNQVEALGLRGTVRFLLALIFPADKLPTELLTACQEAVDERNNVVHNGQRDVRPEKLQRYLSSLRQVCAILAEYQEDE